jgi:hypothetical protein
MPANFCLNAGCWSVHTCALNTHEKCMPMRVSGAEDEALAALRLICGALGKARLRHLNLSDNALGEKGIRACAAAFAEQVRACSHLGGGVHVFSFQ